MSEAALAEGAREATVEGKSDEQPTARGRRRPRRSPLERGKYTFILTFLLPPLAIYVLFVLSPYTQAIYYAFTDWTGLSAKPTFNGLANFRWMWNDPQIRLALKNSLILLLVVPAATLLLGLFLASMLNVGGRRGTAVGGVRGSAIYKVIYFFPQVMSIALIGVLFKYIFAPANAGGILNGLMDTLGLHRFTRLWLVDSQFAFWTVVAVMIWTFAGFYVVLFSAAMQSIPRDIYEAALLDGSGRFATFRHVTVPLVWDTVQVGWMYLAIEAIDGFALVNIMLDMDGGPSRQADVLGVAIYRTSFGREFRFGRASAIGVVMLLLTLIIISIAMRVMRRERVEYA